MIEIDNLFKSYDGVNYVLNDISLNVRSGEMLGLLGPNGAGKTTLTNILSCAIPFQKGEVSILGYDIKTEKAKIKQNISISTQGFAIDYLLSVEDNLTPFIYLYEIDIKTGKQKMKDLLIQFELFEKRKMLACHLSGGQLRRLQIIRALLKSPKILFLDEPTLGLDPVGRMELGNALKTYLKEGITIFLATNEMNEADMLCDRVAFINNGRLLNAKPVQEFISDHIGELLYDIKFSDSGLYDKLKNYLKDKNKSCKIIEEEPLIISSAEDSGMHEVISGFAEENNIVDYEIKRRRANLNDVFLQIAASNGVKSV